MITFKGVIFVEKYRYQKELSELLGIEENDYNTAISNYYYFYWKINEVNV